ncbi:hypothetical protein AM493_13655 [Flavobacterium akiainvivens]|uniref:Uncharacterized protein n=2 Tax=Flavobacterium akiainvivens TaxID=1202724 RepID=A0A0M9VIR7_9FLAO|nr:hypothetical protein AM493_13655 [Flavobacterium akiainvivens]
MAQTKLISHKSHSGSMATFNTAFENNLFDIGESNFGLPDKQMSFTIDSIILLPDDKVVVVSSEKDVYRHYAKSAISFKPGRDTLYNHPLLSQKHKKDSILRVLQPYDAKHKPVLINYDNNKTKKNSLPVAPNDSLGTPNMPLMVAALAALSILFGFVFYMVHKLKSARLA